MSKILIAGDCVPTKTNQKLFMDGNIEKLFGHEIVTLFKESDLSMINLEVSLTEKMTPMLKRGQINTASPKCCKALSLLGVDLCLLANNHVIDNSKEGLESTISTLNKYNIKHIGAGINKDDAFNDFKLEINNKVVKIINISDNEFNDIREYGYGVHVYDPLETFDYIDEYKKNADYLIVVFHGGIEHYRYPTPKLQKICRKMIDKGADLVTCQHSHCIGTYEEYKGKKIFYGQGNFIFDEDDEDMHKTAILLEVDIENDFNINIIPVLKIEECVRMADKDSAKTILDNIESRRLEIQDSDKVKELFNQLCLEKENEYYNVMLCYNKILKILNKLSNGYLYKYMFNQFNCMRIRNVIESNALYEVMLGIMKKDVNLNAKR